MGVGCEVKAGRGGQEPWRAWAFVGAWLALFAALISPLDRLAGALFSAHMVQHLLLILAAAPLLAVSAPLGTLLLGPPPPLAVAFGRQWKSATGLQTAWRWLSYPAMVWALHSLALWVWHAPVFFGAALAIEWLHVFEHISLLGTAWLFWWVCVHPTRRAAWLRGPGGALFVFTLAMPSGFLGMLITVAPSPWYDAYAVSSPNWGVSPLGDQQVAGALMWMPAGLVYVAAAVGMLAVWFKDEERAAGAGSSRSDVTRAQDPTKMR